MLIVWPFFYRALLKPKWALFVSFSLWGGEPQLEETRTGILGKKKSSGEERKRLRLSIARKKVFVENPFPYLLSLTGRESEADWP